MGKPDKPHLRLVGTQPDVNQTRPSLDDYVELDLDQLEASNPDLHGSGFEPAGIDPAGIDKTDPALLELASSFDESSLVTFAVSPAVGLRRTGLTLTTQRLIMGDDAVHLVNITGIACSAEVLREGIGPLPRRYLLQVQESSRIHEFSFIDTAADRYITRAGYEALMAHLRSGVFPMVHSELERQIDAGSSVMIGALEIGSTGFSVGGLPVAFNFANYVGCRQQDHLLLVEVADPEPRVVAEVPVAAMNAHILPDLLREQCARATGYANQDAEE